MDGWYSKTGSQDGRVFFRGIEYCRGLEMEEQHRERSKPLVEPQFTLRFRLLGVLPLAFFLAQAVHYWRLGQLGHMLWMCNIGNLVLAIGLFLGQPVLIRVAAIWSIPGVVIWFRYVVMEWGFFGSSTSAHVGGLIVGLVALKKVRVDRAAWLYCFGWFLILQLVSRWATPAELNVNAAHTIYQGWQQIFRAYWQFWLVMTLLTVVALWLLGLALNKLWPARPAVSS